MNNKVVMVVLMIFSIGFLYGVIAQIWLTRFLIKRNKVPSWLKKLGFVPNSPAGADGEKNNEPS